MGFTPKETPTGAFPIPDIPYSAWITSNLTSGKPVGDRLTIALCWKPTNGSLMRFKPGASGYKPDHYRLTIIKSYGSVYVWDDFTKISTKSISTDKIPLNDSGAFLQKVLELVAGCHHGYYSHVKVMDECLGHPQDFYGVHPVDPSIIFAKEIHSLLRPTAIWVRGGEATASSEYNSTYSAGKAFDGSEKTGTGWISKTRGTGWLSYVWVNTPKVITAYRLISTVGGSDNSRVPSTFSLKARKTGGDWVLLDKYVGKTSETWAGKLRTFENNTAYNEYRLNISATRGNREPLIRELKLCEQQPLTSYGSNGCFLDFADAANLGKDMSGNDAHWSITGKQALDTATNNFATFSRAPNAYRSDTVFSYGNRYVDIKGMTIVMATEELSSGKWYAEFTPHNLAAANRGINIGVASHSMQSAKYLRNGQDKTWGVADTPHGSLVLKTNGRVDRYTGWDLFGTDTIGVALDVDAGTLDYYRNGKRLGRGFSNIVGPVAFAVAGSYDGYPFSVGANFGSTGFKSVPPAGYLPVCTKNIT